MDQKQNNEELKEQNNRKLGSDEDKKKALEKVNSILPKDKQLKKVDDLKAIDNLYILLKEKVETAIRNSKKLQQNEKTKDNPSSGMYLLVESLFSNN